ncbi:hypothetical protein L208DRAFT_1406843 [Tricholoma matsutake]|nr:hypothetical protein L208DRAFT_1406843 [Tricholoma matsutake 945]
MGIWHFLRPVPPPALLSADLGLVSRVQSIVDWVETYNLRGGRPIVEDRQWPIIGLSWHGPHPIGRVLAYSTWDFIGKGWTTDIYTMGGIDGEQEEYQLRGMGGGTAE